LFDDIFLHGTGIWVEPIHYNGDMIRVASIKDKPCASPMGENLRGRILRGSAPETPPFNFNDSEDSNGDVIVDGSLCRILIEASKYFNFTAIVDYAGYDYGTLHDNGTWTGSYSKVHYPDSGYDISMITSAELLWTQFDLGSNKLSKYHNAPIPAKSSISFLIDLSY
jgi:hypothetical protein